MTTTKKKTTKKRQRIILCAGENGRAVLIGEVDREPVPGKAVKLHDARMVLYWDAACGGLLGLAAKGPRGGTRITEPVPATVATVWREWVAVTEVSASEVDKWAAC